MKRRNYAMTMVIGVFAAVLVLGMIVVRPLLAVQGESEGLRSVSLQAARAGEFSISGEYEGQVALEGVFSGVYSDALEPEPADLGYIDLALELEQSGDQVSGYVLLDRTLVFTQEHMLAGIAVGPLVNGTFDGVTLDLLSEAFTRTVSSGRTLPEDGRNVPARKATRQFSLLSTKVFSPGLELAGTYRETIWGLTPKPTTVVGTFSLQRPDFAPYSEMKIYLPVVVKGL